MARYLIIFMKKGGVMKRTMNLLIVSLFLVAGMTACYSSAYVATVPVSVSTPLPSNRVIVTTAQTTNSYPVNRPIAQNSDITITANSDEISANLDLRAIANIFAECSTLEEFEQKINDYRICGLYKGSRDSRRQCAIGCIAGCPRA